MSEAEQVVQPEVTEAPVSTIETPAEVASGGSGNDFLNSIPEDLRQHPSLSPIKDVGNLARSYVNAQRLIGADKIPMPINPTDEDLDRIYGKLGRPETPDQYQIAADGNIVTEEIATGYADVAHKLRLTPDQANGILEYYRSVTQGNIESMNATNQQSLEETTSALQAEWGDKFDAKVDAAQKVVDQFEAGNIMEMQLADGTKLGNHPDVIRAFAKFAEFKQSVTSEDTVKESSQVNYMTKQTAQAEVDAIMRGPDYTSRDAIARDRAVNRVQELMEIIHG
tara:strand:- start:682 stop:1524 length:843 start_codon:yes stop_codon:yes gene_type:complete